MNVHPIFVHFPVALLTLYSIMEILHLRFFRALPYWFYTKAIMLIIGTVGSYIAFFTGSLIEDNFRGTDQQKLVSLHSNFGATVAIYFSVISALYIISWINRVVTDPTLTQNSFWKFLVSVESLFIESVFAVLIGFAGLVLITITGALGGAIAYGTQGDFVTNFIYSLFFK
jgi:uncharacterized membrane protein